MKFIRFKTYFIYFAQFYLYRAKKKQCSFDCLQEISSYISLHVRTTHCVHHYNLQPLRMNRPIYCKCSKITWNKISTVKDKNVFALFVTYIVIKHVVKGAP